MANPLQELHDAGQSIWLDYIRRDLLTSGELKRMIDEDAITGMTSNPTIFEKAISGSADYDAQIQDLAEERADAPHVFEVLATTDIRMAADILRPVYDRTDGADGFVSIEVSPEAANDTQASIDEAKLLWKDVDRPNLMVKIPGTREGAPAVEELLAAGLNINITLLFAVDAYVRVVEAYLAALERRVKAGQPIDRIASVASFFVSRVDTLVDKQLDAKLKQTQDPREQDQLKDLHGKAAIANAKIAYQRFQEYFGSERFEALKAHGARVQRPLWASTSTKNPAYRDVLYIEELIGPETVNTMPPATIIAFRDHGRVARTVDHDLPQAHAVLDELKQAGIEIDAVTAQLLEEGIKSFADSYTELRNGIDEKLKALADGSTQRQHAHLFAHQAAVDGAIERLTRENFVRRVWEKDPTAWTADETAAASIRNRLGWLDVSDHMLEQAPAMTELAEQVREAGYTHALLLGMGGSSLCPEVLRQTFGTRDGYPDLKVLDSTDPATIRAREAELDPAKTLFIVSSKSGTTTEPNDFFKYFWARVEALKGDRAGENFVAITDPGTPLQTLAEKYGFRRVFQNPPDIGGRYSALSYFGMVPGAIMGVDITALLSRAQRMEQCCVPVVPVEQNPGVLLGAAIGVLATAGRNKLTFVCSPPIGSFGLWLEQLIAESTGKEGTGVVPIATEPLGDPGDYGDDRLFVYVRLAGKEDAEQERRMAALETAKQPLLRITLQDPLDLGQEFFRWEMATATAAAILGINPFDEPNVQESKDNTKRLLREYESTQRLPQPRASVESDGIALSSRRALGGDGLVGGLRGFLSEVRPGDYVALMAYIEPTEENEQKLAQMRAAIETRLRVATTLGFGPRFLHSTGQLHKGGPNLGVYIQLTGVDGEDLAIPGDSYSFQILIDAQALGDLLSLENHGRRVIRLNLGTNVPAGLDAVRQAVTEALGIGQ
jgi:transaldolase/glucose-6-phosphate isomerase